MIYVYSDNIKFKEQIRYVFDVFFYVLGVKYEYIENSSEKKINDQDILIRYVREDINENDYENKFWNIINIYESEQLLGSNYLNINSIPKTIMRYTLKEKNSFTNDIISIYCNKEVPYIKEVRDKKYIVSTNIDLISNAFFMLTRYEEVVSNNTRGLDQFDRFPAANSLAFKNHFLHRPIVNEYISLLWSFIQKFNLNYEKKLWWNGSELAACISHDIDVLQKFRSVLNLVTTTGNLILRHRNALGAFRNIVDFIESKIDFNKDPFWTFDYILDIEKKNKFKSSFYFMSGGSSQFDNFYNINDSKVTNLVKKIEDDGFEIGYHGSFNSFNKESEMKKEKDNLDTIVSNKPYGIRQHYLRFKVPDTWRLQEKLGFLYDTTMGFANHEGFRTGMCFPFKIYDIIEERILNLWEIPLIVMEGTLKESSYRNLSPDEGFEVIKSLIDEVKKYNGVFTILWHNSSFDYNWRGWEQIFENTISYLNENNCWGVDGRTLIKHFEKNN